MSKKKYDENSVAERWGVVMAKGKSVKSSEMTVALCIPDLQYLPTTDYWVRLVSIVKNNADIRTGKFPLFINQGGLQNNQPAKEEKELFKKEVLPDLMNFLGVSEPLTGTFNFHLAEGQIKIANLTFKCKEGHVIPTIF